MYKVGKFKNISLTPLNVHLILVLFLEVVSALDVVIGKGDLVVFTGTIFVVVLGFEVVNTVKGAVVVVFVGFVTDCLIVFGVEGLWVSLLLLFLLSPKKRKFLF